MRRAGLDYREYANLKRYKNFDNFLSEHNSPRVFGISTRGKKSYHEETFQPQDAIVFGPETRGLPAQLLDDLGPANTLRIPMKGDSRSLNLSNAAALVAYEGLRQMGFEGLS